MTTWPISMTTENVTCHKNQKKKKADMKTHVKKQIETKISITKYRI